MCGGGYGNAPTKRGGSDGKGKGSNNRPKRHERPIAAAARGMGRGGGTICDEGFDRCLHTSAAHRKLVSVVVGVSRL